MDKLSLIQVVFFIIFGSIFHMFECSELENSQLVKNCGQANLAKAFISGGVDSKRAETPW
jgi:hypothetical protein